MSPTIIIIGFLVVSSGVFLIYVLSSFRKGNKPTNAQGGINTDAEDLALIEKAKEIELSSHQYKKVERPELKGELFKKAFERKFNISTPAEENITPVVQPDTINTEPIIEVAEHQQITLSSTNNSLKSPDPVLKPSTIKSSFGSIFQPSEINEEEKLAQRRNLIAEENRKAREAEEEYFMKMKMKFVTTTNKFTAMRKRNSHYLSK